MKTIEFSFGGKHLRLYLNGEAMFALDELDAQRGTELPEIMDQALEQSPAGYDALCQVAEVLATQGEHCRRYLHYEPERVPSARELRLLLSPMQMLGLRTAVVRAVNAGYAEAKDDDTGDIDIGLAELEKKTKF